MKFIFSILMLLFVFGCKAQNTKTTNEQTKTVSSSFCPENASCFFELIPNSSLIVKSDEFGNTYINIEKGEKLIFKYSYKQNENKEYVDGHYYEEVYAELDSNLSEIELKDKELQTVKLLFNRVCYCKGFTGFYKIEKGQLTIKKTAKNKFSFQLEFKVDEVPQIITSINETLIVK